MAITIKGELRCFACSRYLGDFESHPEAHGKADIHILQPEFGQLPQQAVKSKSGLRRFRRANEPKIKPKVLRTYTVKKTKQGKASGDNSNTQYAALGLRACHDSGMIIPKQVIQKASDWWLKSQHVGVKESGYGK